MRSQKQVRRVGKVRSVKNAVAGKRKTYRKRLEARKAWQHNTIMTKHRAPNNFPVLLSATHKKIKEPKQRSAEELAERQRLREQKRLEKELAKQRASTSALPKIKKEKKVNEVFSGSVPKKTSNGQKAATRTMKAKKILMEDTAKAKYLKTEQTKPAVNVQQQAVAARETNEQKKAKKQQKSEIKSQSHQKLLVEKKGERMEVPEGHRKSKPSTPKMNEEKALVQSKTRTSDISKTDKKPSGKEERTEQVVGNTRNDEVQSSIAISMVDELQQKGNARDVLIGSKMDSDVKTTDSSYEPYEDRSLKQEWEVVQAEETMEEDGQGEVNMGRGMAEEMNTKQKKKRNRQPNAGYRLSDNDFTEGDAHEMDEEKASTDFKEIVGRRFKEKKNHDDQQPRYEESFFEDVVPVSRSGVEEFPSENCLHDKLTVPECYTQLQQRFSRNNNADSDKYVLLAGLHGETQLFGAELFKVSGEGQRFEKEGNNLENECFQKGELERGEMQDTQIRRDIQNEWSNAGKEHLIDRKSEQNNFLDQIESHREMSEDDAIQRLTQELPERLGEFEIRKPVDAEEHVYNDELEPDRQQGALGESADCEDRKHAEEVFPKEKAGMLVAEPFIDKGFTSESFVGESIEHVERSLPKKAGTELPVGHGTLDEEIKGMEEFFPVEESGVLVIEPPTDHGSHVERIDHVEESSPEEKIGVFVAKPPDHGPCDGCVKHVMGPLKEDVVAVEHPADRGSHGERVEEQRVEESFAKNEPSMLLSELPVDHVAFNGCVLGEDVEHTEESLAKGEGDTLVTEPPTGHGLPGGGIEQDGQSLAQKGTSMIVTKLPGDNDAPSEDVKKSLVKELGTLITELPAGHGSPGESTGHIQESLPKEEAVLLVAETPVDRTVLGQEVNQVEGSFSKRVDTLVAGSPFDHGSLGEGMKQISGFCLKKKAVMLGTVLHADHGSPGKSEEFLLKEGAGVLVAGSTDRGAPSECVEYVEESLRKEASTVVGEASADQDARLVSFPVKDVKRFENSGDSDLRKDVAEPVGRLSPNENAQHVAEAIANERMPEGPYEQKAGASEAVDEKGSVAEAKIGTEIECGRLVQGKAGEPMSTVQSEGDASLLTVVVADFQDGIDEQVKKEQEHVGRGGKDSVNEVLAPPTEDQNYFLVGPRFKTEEAVDHITLSEAIPKTEMSTEALSAPKELQMNMAKRAGEHSELLSTISHDSIGAVNGKMTSKTYTKEAELAMNVEKREPIVLALERDGARRVQPVRERVYKLLPRDVQFCVRMIEKHGEDYEAMAKDEGNTFRDSAKGIARKIRIFKESPQYEAYLKQKDDQKGLVS